MRALASRFQLRQYLGFAALFVAVALGSLVIFNFPWFWSQIRYTGGGHPISAPSGSGAGDAFIITIPKIGVQAPVILSEHRDWDSLRAELGRGAVHYAGTALPGELGHIVITGHSSNYFWDPGKYNYVFSLLGKLDPGDEIDLTYGGTVRKYRVTEKFVKDSDRGELAPSSRELLSVTTCWPPFTSWQRLIVRAEPIEKSKTPSIQKKLLET